MTNPCNEREGSRIMKELEKPTSPSKEYSAHFSHPLMRARGTHKRIHFHMPANRIPWLTRAKQKIRNNSLSLVSTGCRIHSTLNRHSRHLTLHRNVRLIHNSFSWSQDQISLPKNVGRRSQEGRAIRDSARGYFALVATVSVQSPVFSARWKQCWREDEPGKY